MVSTIVSKRPLAINAKTGACFWLQSLRMATVIRPIVATKAARPVRKNVASRGLDENGSKIENRMEIKNRIKSGKI